MKALLFFLGMFFTTVLWSQTVTTQIGELPALVKETSGLLFYNGRLITHNDSGNLPQLYEIDTTSLAIVRTVTIANVQNIDWEDLTQDDDFIYIGDFGNNRGDRRDLRILKISKTDYGLSDVVVAEEINFMYEDQIDFETTGDSDFDAESLFSLQDDLIVLTKQWQQKGTVAYRIPKIPGAFLAERMDTYQVNGLVTAAAFDSASSQLFLVGYSEFLVPFFATIADVNPDAIFGGEKEKTNLDIGFAQVEALALITPDHFYVSSEEFINPPLVNTASRLFSLLLNESQEGEGGGVDPIDTEVDPEGFIVFKTFGSDQLNYNLNITEGIVAMGIFDSSGRLISYEPLERITTDPIDISTLGQSLYYLTFFLVDGAISAPFYKD